MNELYKIIVSIREAENIEKAESILRSQFNNILNEKPYGYIVSHSTVKSVESEEEAIKHRDWYNKFKRTEDEESYIIPLYARKY